jgi:hypothetical protein
MSNPLAAARFYALRDVDEAAGRARLRYITDVPGQQAVYMTKLQQAQAYAAAFALDAQAPVPSYLAAEAAATGMTAVQVTDNILALAALWNDQAGPGIEGARMGGKAAVTAAADLEAVEAARVAAVQALDSFGS